LAAELRVSSASHSITLQNIRYISRMVIYRSSRPGDCPGELPVQHPRPTFWHPQVATWPETATPVAVRLDDHDRLQITAACGLEDLLQGVCRRNPRRVSVEWYRHRVHAKQVWA
jgi:Nucleotidyltransferase